MGLMAKVHLTLKDYFFLLFQKKALGQTVFDHVLRKLGILERDYFGLQYHEDDQKEVRGQGSPQSSLAG